MIAQDVPQAPNYSKIKKSISDSTSSFYYSRLMDRYSQSDSTLTIEEFRHLYYGYTYQSEYSPYWRSEYDTDLSKFYRKPELKKKDQLKVIKLGSLTLDAFPFELRVLNFLAYVYHLQGSDDKAMELSFRLQGILGAIYSTGDGMTCKTGMHVIATSHEYVIINMNKFNYSSQSLTDDGCDYMEFVKDERNIDGLYFNIERLLDINLKTLKRNNK